MLRRLILDTCEINEILLAPINLFRPMAISRTCIITLTKRLCEKGYKYRSDHKKWRNKSDCSCESCKKRKNSKIHLIDRVKSQKEYNSPFSENLQVIKQELYEKIFGNPFWINVPLKFIETLALANPDVISPIKDHWRYEELRKHIKGGVGLQTGDNSSHLVIIKDSVLWKNLQGSYKLEKYRVMSADKIIDLSEASEESLNRYQVEGIDGDKFLVKFVRGSKSRYWERENWFIDWSPSSVEQIKSHDSARFQNTSLYFRKGFITDAHHGILTAILVENSIPAVNTNFYAGIDLETEFLLGYMNSHLASFFLGKIINTSLGGMSGHATPEDIRRLPIRLPTNEKTRKIFHYLKNNVIDRVNTIIKLIKSDLYKDIIKLQAEIDEIIFQWFSFDENDKKIVEEYIKRMIEERNRY